MNKRIYWIEGDGIGPEIWKAARPVIEAALAAENTGIKLEWTELLAGDKAVLEWMKGTALRPYLTALDGDPTARDAFLAALGGRLSAAFPRRPDGATLLPFPRLFLVAQRR